MAPATAVAAMAFGLAILAPAHAVTTAPSGSAAPTAPAWRLPNSAVCPAWGGRTSPLVREATHMALQARVRTERRRWTTARRMSKMSATPSAPPRIVIAGAPASGKGTQCALLKESLGLVHLSTGDMLRAAVEAKTDVGVAAKGFMDAGKLVPDEIIIGIVKERLDQDDCKTQGWLLDGFPRTQAQAEALAEAGIDADVFLLLNVPDEELITRVVGRRLDPETGDIYHMKYAPPPSEEVAARLTQRSDDTEEKARVRLDTYHENINAVRGCYKEILCEIDGCQSKSDVFDAIMKRVGTGAIAG